ncbi:hypothetical protein [Streptomyces sp. bgisy034]|uniref:hypothetical protein n=1 Tax=Streptomyces sp. bgisy034 TaxID=3413774 RepID=UPI003EB6FD4A
MPKRVQHAAVAMAAALLALTACQYEQGPAGRVVDRDKTYWPATKQWTYKLTVRKPDGTEATFKVKRSDYQSCPKQSTYPTCTEVR